MATETVKNFDEKKHSDTFIDLSFGPNGTARFRLQFVFDNFSSIKDILPLVEMPAFATPVLDNLIRGNVSYLKDAIDVANETKIVLPFSFKHCFDLLGFRGYHESGISNALEKAETLYTYLSSVKSTKGLSALPRINYIPYPSKFSKEEAKVRMTFKLLELFEPSKDLYITVQPLLHNRHREEENVDMINEFFDNHRDRKDIIKRATVNGKDLDLPEADESESDSENTSTWKSKEKKRPVKNNGPRRWEKNVSTPQSDKTSQTQTETKPPARTQHQKNATPRRTRADIDE